MADIRLVRAEDLVESDRTPGMRRQQAIVSDGGWTGLAHTQPGSVSGWHHHAAYETSIYVTTGALRLEYGPGGASAVEAHPGDFVHVPPGVIHREGNLTDQVATLVLMRVGRGAPSVNVDGPD